MSEEQRSTGHWRQSTALLELLAASGPGGFAVPHCPACGHRFYPAQSWCPRCLASDVEYATDSGVATVISMAELRISFDANWNSRLPIHVACVRTASGVSLFAMADGPLCAGTQVRIQVAEATPAFPALLRVIACV